VIGHVLPATSTVATVTLDGRRTAYLVRQTARGREVVVDAGTGTGTSALVVTLAG
jgi:predicted RNA methylase